jgi:hypothetical protein
MHLIDKSNVVTFIAATVPTFTASFGQGTGTIALNNVLCRGTEARLVDCSSGIVTGCSHSEDAGVRCQAQTGK